MEKPINASTCESEVIEMLKILLSHHLLSQVTDIHIRNDNTVRARIRGVLLPAVSWENFTDKDGKLINGQSYSGISDLLLGSKPDDPSSRVYRTNARQVRVQPVVAVNSKKLIIRVQPLSPPPLLTLLKDHPKFIEHIANASGLVVVCGPVGSGKTTTAASIAMHWANRRLKHVVSFEDPVEYQLAPQSGDATQISCNLVGLNRAGTLPGIREALAHALRYDLDAAFIGEVRDGETRAACLSHASTREPVVTTIHAGGIADAVLRLTEPVRDLADQATLRLSLSNCLHAIIYVDLAFNDKGDAVPVIVAISGKTQALRNAIADAPAKNLANTINHVLSQAAEEDGGINPNRAKEVALAAGASEASVLAALPPDVRNELNALSR